MVAFVGAFASVCRFVCLFWKFQSARLPVPPSVSSVFLACCVRRLRACTTPSGPHCQPEQTAKPSRTAGSISLVPRVFSIEIIRADSEEGTVRDPHTGSFASQASALSPRHAVAWRAEGGGQGNGQGCAASKAALQLSVSGTETRPQGLALVGGCITPGGNEPLSFMCFSG